MDRKQITITVIITILTTVATVALWAGGLSRQQDINTKNIECLQENLNNEIIERKDEHTNVMIKLTEIDTNVLYIKEYIIGEK